MLTLRDAFFNKDVKFDRFSRIRKVALHRVEQDQDVPWERFMEGNFAVLMALMQARGKLPFRTIQQWNNWHIHEGMRHSDAPCALYMRQFLEAF